jgi:hypothetical protein
MIGMITAHGSRPSPAAVSALYQIRRRYSCFYILSACRESGLSEWTSAEGSDRSLHMLKCAFPTGLLSRKVGTSGLAKFESIEGGTDGYVT